MYDNDNFTFYRLLDADNYGLIVKCKGHLQYVYRAEKQSWVRTGLMTKYFCDEDPCYECYEEISETEALEDIEKYFKV